jgi:hypothetical protein
MTISPAPSSPERARYAGQWRKDVAASDPLDCACDALQLQGKCCAPEALLPAS